MSWQQHLRPSLADASIYDVPPARAGARLHANECPEPWPEEVLHAVAERLRACELNRYPDTSGRRLRALLGQRSGCDPDRIVLGNGSDEIIALLQIALSGSTPGAVVTPAPTFVMYGMSARVLGFELREVPLDDALQLDEAGLRRALPGATLCFLARPNNPTSSLWDAALIERLIADFPSTVFVVDEAYVAYAPGQSMWHPDRPENYVHMATLSKVGLAAIRVGYAIACPALAEALNKVRHPYNISATSLLIAQTVLSEFADVQTNMIERAIANRARLVELMRSIPGAEVYPAHGNMVLARLRSADEVRALVDHVAQHGVLVKAIGDCVRASVGTADELDLFARALATR